MRRRTSFGEGRKELMSKIELNKKSIPKAENGSSKSTVSSGINKVTQTKGTKIEELNLKLFPHKAMYAILINKNGNKALRKLGLQLQ